MPGAVGVLTWNVAGRLSRIDEQAERVVEHGADVVCLQEVIPNALARWTSRLQAAGYAVTASTVLPDAPRLHRRGVLIASRHPLSSVRRPPAVAWSERLLTAEVHPAGWPRALHVVCLHAPLSQSADRAKVRTLEAVYAHLAAVTTERAPALLCGDLNTPQYEARDASIMTFAQTSSGRLRPERGERHDRAERMILSGPPGWRDAFRAPHGYEARDRSWKTGRHPGYRLDHILVSPELTPLACHYDHSLRLDGLSDHSAMAATVALSSHAPSTSADPSTRIAGRALRASPPSGIRGPGDDAGVDRRA